jgi:uncharacterized phage protein gp47/JayE
MNCTCGCCAGTEVVTPADIGNPPGLTALGRRVGTHGRFLESMLARLSAQDALTGLTIRDTGDIGIALLDGWAVLGDVLTFYQERIANEGYLRTATEPESLLELGRLLGYRPRPALGASVHLAYTLDPGARATIPAGSRVRSVPAQGELPQTFETAEDLDTREEWNVLGVRRTGPPAIDPATAGTGLTGLTIAGTATSLRPADRLLFLFGASQTPASRVVNEARADFPAGVTTVSLVAAASALGPVFEAADELRDALDEALDTRPTARAADGTATVLTAMLDSLSETPARAGLPDALRELREEIAVARPRARTEVTCWFDDPVDAVIEATIRVVTLVAAEERTGPPDLSGRRDVPIGRGESPPSSPPAGDTAAAALLGLAPLLAAMRKPPSRPPANARQLTTDVPALFAPDSDTQAQLLAAADPRLAGLHDAWSRAEIAPPLPLAGLQVMRVKARMFPGQLPGSPPGLLEIRAAGDGTILPLDAVYDGIVAGSWVIVEDPELDEPLIRRVIGVYQIVAGRQVGTGDAQSTVDVAITVLTVDDALEGAAPDRATVWAQGEPLTVLGDPLTADIGGGAIELDRPYDGLRAGRWLIVSGERTDVPFTTGVRGSELAMVAGIRQRVDPEVPGDTVHATLLLAADLAYTYRRDTVQVRANVVAATQGESRTEVLGSGDAGASGQEFTLRQVTPTTPLTWLPADNPLGAEDTLTVRVGGVAWHGTDALTWSGPSDHDYAERDGADGTATVLFGDGVRGSRLATGVENVTAEYRVGAGRSGDLVSGQISQLVSRPLGVSGVGNPLPSTGGADGDRPADTRARIPSRVLALDRLVSVRDYEDLTRARAGIGKASASRLYDGEREVVHVTVAGMDDVPIDESSALFTALEAGLAAAGDPHLPVRVAIRDLVLLVLSAGVRVEPGRSWDLVEPVLKAVVLDELGFARRKLGEPAYLSRVVAAMQAVPGVDYVDVDVFAGIPGVATPAELAAVVDSLTGAAACVPARLARFAKDEHVVTDLSETLTSVAAGAGLTLDELVRLNPGLAGPVLAPGQRLTVYRGVRPAELAVLTPAVPETLILRRIP